MSWLTDLLGERLTQLFRHAFALGTKAPPFSPEEKALLEKVAFLVHRYGMTTPAIILLESVAPLNFVGSQLLYCLGPILESALPSIELDKIARILERREAIPLLRQLIEEKIM
jgi:hypothetical protein